MRFYAVIEEDDGEFHIGLLHALRIVGVKDDDVDEFEEAAALERLPAILADVEAVSELIGKHADKVAKMVLGKTAVNEDED
jgi:hypothetical protein